MPDLLTVLTSVAVSFFRERADPSYTNTEAEVFDLLPVSDPVIRDAQRRSLVIPTRHKALEELTHQVFADADFAPLGPRPGELDPMLLHSGGGVRTWPGSLVAGLLSSASLQIYLLRLAPTESTFARTVMEGFEELRRAARGEQVRAYVILGIAGILLPEGTQVSTPWGTLRPTPLRPPERRFLLGFQQETTCILAEPRLLSVRFDRAASPTSEFDPAEATPGRSQVLFPLSCALASKDAANPAAPLVTWFTLLLPFQYGFGYSSPVLPPRVKPPVALLEGTSELEEWCRIVEASHTPTVEVAARRLVSASTHRLDRADALIDAVMVWENLVGTSIETTFRVTAALAKILEPDRLKRRELAQPRQHRKSGHPLARGTLKNHRLTRSCSLTARQVLCGKERSDGGSLCAS